jgi:hypothetical protein
MKDSFLADLRQQQREDARRNAPPLPTSIRRGDNGVFYVTPAAPPRPLASPRKIVTTKDGVA